MEEKDSKSKLQFKNGNPGAVQFGNFINYYQFHPPDNRIKLLPKEVWNQEESFHGLDVGCNTGILTKAVYDFLADKVKIASFLGIDIDPVLVERANEANTMNLISFKQMNFMEESERTFLQEYLTSRGVLKFSAIFCFSVTMWIHLNYGDAGLEQFLMDVCKYGKLIVIEPQPWKCYKSAVKRLKQSNFTFDHFKTLKYRENVEEVIEQYLVGKCNALKIYDSSRSDWDRKIMVFLNTM